MKSEILISFIVPVYNTQQTIQRCIDSILSQTKTNFEIIVVNDGTKDNSQTIIDGYVSKFPDKIKSFTKENGGLSDARNFGIKKSNGTHIAFVDSDDYIEKNYVELIYGVLCDKNPDLVIIGYNRIYNKKQSFFEKSYKFDHDNTKNEILIISERPDVIAKTEVASWLRVIKKDIFINNEESYFTKGRIYEDLEASLKWYLQIDTVFLLDAKLYNYCISKNTLNSNARNIEMFFEIIDEVCTFYKNKNRFERNYHELEYIFTKHIILSNLLRMRAAKNKKNFDVFMLLLGRLYNYFNFYVKNKYLKSEPLYVRLVVYLAYYFPQFFITIL